jgi:hypothetical protein
MAELRLPLSAGEGGVVMPELCAIAALAARRVPYRLAYAAHCSVRGSACASVRA